LVLRGEGAKVIGTAARPLARSMAAYRRRPTQGSNQPSFPNP
jgi:hypothetical protein